MPPSPPTRPIRNWPACATKKSIGRERYDGVFFVFKDHIAKRLQLDANYTLSWANGYDTGGGSFRNYARNGYAPFTPLNWPLSQR